MLRRQVHPQFADGETSPDTQEVVLLQEEDLVALLKAIREVSKHPDTGEPNTPECLATMMEELGIE